MVRIALLLLLIVCAASHAEAQEMRNVRADEVLPAVDYLSIVKDRRQREEYLAKQRAKPLCCHECGGTGTTLEGHAGYMTCSECDGDGVLSANKIRKRIARLEKELARWKAVMRKAEVTQ